MTFDDALKAAHALAERFGNRLGDCRFADGGPDDAVWIMGFSVLERPGNWFWHIIITDFNLSSIIALRGDPPQEPLPALRRA